MIYQVKGISGHQWVCVGCARVCADVHGCAWVYAGVRVVTRGCRWVWAGVGRCGRVCACVWDEFSEFLPENRVPTSADFNTYPIRIFFGRT